jgi:hypothetical protein
MANANIFQQYLKPVKSVEEYSADLDKAEANQLSLQDARLTAAEKQRSMAEANAFKAALAGNDPSTPDGFARLRAISPTAAMTLQKQLQDMEKSKADARLSGSRATNFDQQTAKSKDDMVQAEANRRAAEFASLPNPQAALADLDAKAQAGIVAPEKAAQLRQELAAIQTPEQFRQFKLRMMAERLLPKDLLALMTPKLGPSMDAGNAAVIPAFDPMTMQPIPGAGMSVAKGVNPSTQMTADTTRRGQDMQLQGSLARAGSASNASARPPAGYRTTPDGNLEAIPGGPADTKIQGQFNQDTATLTGSKAQLDRLAEAANKLMKAPGLERIYGLQGKLPNVPGMAGADAQAQLETLKSQIGFSVLQAMRDASKTGGALGAVTEKELGFLQNNLATLDKAQSVEQARESLQAIIKFTQDSKERLGMAYNMRHGQRAAQKPAAPAVGEVRQGYRFKGGNPADRNSWEQVQ